MLARHLVKAIVYSLVIWLEHKQRLNKCLNVIWITGRWPSICHLAQLSWVFKAFFLLLLLSTLESSDPRGMTWPEEALRWSFMVKLVEESVRRLLCVCPCRLAPCVTWTLHKCEGRRRRTLAACRRLSLASADRVTLCPPLQCHFSLSALWISLLLLPVSLFSSPPHIFIFHSDGRILSLTFLCSWSETAHLFLLCSPCVHVCVSHVGLHVPASLSDRMEKETSNAHNKIKFNHLSSQSVHPEASCSESWILSIKLKGIDLFFPYFNAQI